MVNQTKLIFLVLGGVRNKYIVGYIVIMFHSLGGKFLAWRSMGMYLSLLGMSKTLDFHFD